MFGCFSLMNQNFSGKRGSRIGWECRGERQAFGWLAGKTGGVRIRDRNNNRREK